MGGTADNYARKAIDVLQMKAAEQIREAEKVAGLTGGHETPQGLAVLAVNHPFSPTAYRLLAERVEDPSLKLDLLLRGRSLALAGLSIPIQEIPDARQAADVIREGASPPMKMFTTEFLELANLSAEVGYAALAQGLKVSAKVYLGEAAALDVRDALGCSTKLIALLLDGEKLRPGQFGADLLMDGLVLLRRRPDNDTLRAVTEAIVALHPAAGPIFAPGLPKARTAKDMLAAVSAEDAPLKAVTSGDRGRRPEQSLIDIISAHPSMLAAINLAGDKPASASAGLA